MNPLIYSVEDDSNISHVIHIALTNSGYDVQSFVDGKSMFSALEANRPNLILLDIMLPEMDGIDILKRLKNAHSYRDIPVMIVSAKSTELDKVIGLDTGADDYLLKPFGVLELISRVKALLRRSIKEETGMILQSNGLVLNIEEHSCYYQNEQIPLTSKEFSLLKVLIQNTNKTLTRETIFTSVWGYDFVGETRTLDVHMKEVRAKLTKAGVDPDLIQTVRGVGYKWTE
jgi:two-component system alkaline phosphatase synthesis response regulator PhoP